jgi:hypothetical protein
MVKNKYKIENNIEIKKSPPAGGDLGVNFN